MSEIRDTQMKPKTRALKCFPPHRAAKSDDSINPSPPDRERWRTTDRHGGIVARARKSLAFASLLPLRSRAAESAR